MSTPTTQACSATDTAARAIGRLAAHYKYGDMSATDFTAAANAALDPLRELEQSLLAGAAREAELMDRVEWLERQLALRGIVQP